MADSSKLPTVRGFVSCAGKPRPVVTWWRDKRLVDNNYTSVGDVVHNSFEIRELKRSDFLVVLTCQASNNNVTVAASRSITLDMNREEKRLLHFLSIPHQVEGW
ncbi:hypothetical protein V5799_009002 [Amblyomma americanum]|uniref:Ig-like domain-containing protein n=1 Tax=Amblyomma americanum TaxID=6943 RepID=A0AAQ4FCS4_AMBAM